MEAGRLPRIRATRSDTPAAIAAAQTTISATCQPAMPPAVWTVAVCTVARVGARSGCMTPYPDALVLTGESAPLAGTALAYGPFAAALRDHAGWLLEDDQSYRHLA